MKLNRESYSKNIDIYYSHGINHKLKEKIVDNLLTENDKIKVIKELERDKVYRRVSKLEYENKIYYAKYYEYRKFKKQIKNLFRSTEAVRYFKTSKKLLRKGISVVKPLIAISFNRGIFIKDSILVTEEFPGIELADFLVDKKYKEKFKKEVMIEVARLFSELYRNNFLARDPNLTNVLVKVNDSDGFSLSLVDVDNIQDYPFLPWKIILNTLVKFNALAYEEFVFGEEEGFTKKESKLFFKHLIKFYGKEIDFKNFFAEIEIKTIKRLIRKDKKNIIFAYENLKKRYIEIYD